MFEKISKMKVLNVQPIGAGLSFQDRQTWRSQYSLVVILRSHLKVHTQNFKHNIHTERFF